MSTQTASPIFTTMTSSSTPRDRRGDAAVLAQYIQDITRPTGPEVRAVAA